ncbi:MAG: hypothetical protein U0V75_17885 [Ferruginibacter sp.]
MKTLKIAILGIILSTIILFIFANQVEGGDTNAVLMYFVVFLIPTILLAILNAFYLSFIDKFIKGALKIVCGLIPILILAILSFQKSMIFSYFDGDPSFLTMVSAIGLGITTIVWAFSTIKSTAM